jgi:hypothetical protein
MIFLAEYRMQYRHNDDYVELLLKFRHMAIYMSMAFTNIISRKLYRSTITLRESINIKKHCKEVCQSGA